MTAQGYLSVLDYSNEKSAASFITGDITAVSLPGFLTQWGALRAAVDGIILGTIAEEAAYVFKTRLSNTLPSDKSAQRERKWLVTYEDVTQYFDDPINSIPNAGYRKIFNIEIPTADSSKLPTTLNTDRADLTQPEIAAFVTAFEAIGRSPYGGDVNVLQMEMVGRNL